MKTGCLSRRLRRMPMLRAVVPFAAGIVLCDAFTLPLWFAAGAFVCAGVLALLLRSATWSVALLVIAGFATAQLNEAETTLPRDVRTELEVVIEGIPADRGSYTSAQGVVTAWRDPADGHWYACCDRIIVRADSLTALDAGERIRCRGTVRPFRGGAESFRALMARRGFAGSLYLSEGTLLERLPGRQNTLHRLAVERFSRLGMTGDAGAVVRAMTTGDRSGITPELRTAYSRAGFSHLLAVSGLHTGIVFVLVNALLWWMPLLRRGHVVRNVAVAATVWLFVAAAGFPPSAVRAAVMCTVLQFTLAAGAEHSGLNGLAAAALGMLLYNPAWLGDVSFQLSFAAVAAILAWGVPLCRRVRTPWRVVDAVLHAFVISMVATLATAPLVSHVFGILPLAGIVFNPAAIVLATLAVFAGALWLLLPLVALAVPLRVVAEYAAGGIDALARLTAWVPGGVVEYTLGTVPTIGVYLFFAAATALAWCAEPKKSVHLPA